MSKTDLKTSHRFPGPVLGPLFGLVLLAVTALLLTPAAPAQNPPGGPPPGGPPPGRGWRGMRGPGPEGFGHRGLAKVVTGEPYSAQAVTTTVQTLADGTTIKRQITASIARDSEGRTMRSQTFDGFGAAGGQQNGATIVSIFDPVANQRIEYNATTKTARILVLPQRSGAGQGPGRQRGPHGNHSSQVGVQTESLSTQTIAGVSVDGTKTTRTIAAGALGNDKPLVSTDEEWYSPELQMVIQSTRNDPRFGQTTYILSNLQRTEPNASLFQVPAGFQTKTVDVPSHPPMQ